MRHSKPTIALFIDRMSDGGVQRSFLGMAAAFLDQGCDVDLVIGDGQGEHHQTIPPAARVITLGSGALGSRLSLEVQGRWQAIRAGDHDQAKALPHRWRCYLPGLVHYLKNNRPDALLSAKTQANLIALLARRRAAVPTRIVVSERTHLSTSVHHSRRSWKADVLPTLISALYPEADGIIAISSHVADDLSAIGKIERTSIETIHNGLLRPEAIDQPAADHPWFKDDTPVALGVGRLSKEKDFKTLIRAFAKLQAERPVRLMILGEGRERGALEALASELGVRSNVDLQGFVANPYAFMKAADVFVLSSTHEGFGNALLEALACGCPVVSTACPGGPAEILQDGKIGPLVPVGDADAMAAAIASMLDLPTNRHLLLERASAFSMDRVAQRYLDLLLPAWQGKCMTA